MRLLVIKPEKAIPGQCPPSTDGRAESPGGSLTSLAANKDSLLG